MKIKFQTSIAGTRFSHKPGDVVEWPDDAEAQRLIDSGAATLVDGEQEGNSRKKAVKPAGKSKATK